MKSFIGLFLMSYAGNTLLAIVSAFIENDDVNIDIGGADYLFLCS